MGKKCNGCCCFSWLSGIFGLLAIGVLVHILASTCLLCKMTGSINEWLAFGIAAILAIAFCVIGCKKHKDDGSSGTC